MQYFIENESIFGYERYVIEHTETLINHMLLNINFKLKCTRYEKKNDKNDKKIEKLVLLNNQVLIFLIGYKEKFKKRSVVEIGFKIWKQFNRV